MPGGCEKLHYLLSTPFRYPPLRHGSRFGSSFEPSLLYASRSSDTVLAEAAYYRLVFWQGMAVAPASGLTTQHTLFGGRFKTERGLRLQKPPFDSFRSLLAHPRTIWKHRRSEPRCEAQVSRHSSSARPGIRAAARIWPFYTGGAVGTATGIRRSLALRDLVHGCGFLQSGQQADPEPSDRDISCRWAFAHARSLTGIWWFAWRSCKGSGRKHGAEEGSRVRGLIGWCPGWARLEQAVPRALASGRHRGGDVRVFVLTSSRANGLVERETKNAAFAAFLKSFASADYSGRMFEACIPLGPCLTSNSTRWFSARVLKPLLWISRKCAKGRHRPDRGDEAEALGIVEPFYGTGLSAHYLRSIK